MNGTYFKINDIYSRRLKFTRDKFVDSMPNPKCKECGAFLNNKWGKSADTGETYLRTQWRCPCSAHTLMKCKNCCGCRTSAWGGGSSRVVVADAPSHNTAARSRSPQDRAATIPTVFPLTNAQRGLRCTAAEVKERKRAVYRRLPGGHSRAAWPLPGHAPGEELGRDAVPYVGVGQGLWQDGLWLDHVASALDTPLWVEHAQTWSVREELFLGWAQQRRLAIVSSGQAPEDALLTRAELRVQSARRANADLIGNLISTSLC
jgi:hypothetical protein